MISGVFGLPASGKSLYLSFLGDIALQGKSLNTPFHTFGHFNHYDAVYSTTPIKGAYKLEYDDIGKVRFENALLLMDEIMMGFDSRDFKTLSKEAKHMFSQSRKYGLDIIYSSQSYDDCDKKIRGLTDNLYYIERAFGNYSRVRPIKAFFRISDGQIRQGYEFAPPAFDIYFDRKKCYELTDTKALISPPELIDKVPEPW